MFSFRYIDDIDVGHFRCRCFATSCRGSEQSRAHWKFKISMRHYRPQRKPIIMADRSRWHTEIQCYFANKLNKRLEKSKYIVILFESLIFRVPVIAWGSTVNGLVWRQNVNNSMLLLLLLVTPHIMIMPAFTTLWLSIRFLDDGMAFANSHGVCICRVNIF